MIGEDLDSAINFLKSKGLLRGSLRCSHCFESMIWRPYRKIKDNYVWKCENKLCLRYKTTQSIRRNSIFQDTSMDLQMAIYAIYLWSIGKSHKVIVNETGIYPVKVTELCKYFRNVCRKYFVRNPIKLGGEGVVCQIDESLFNHKQKYHKGRISDHQLWVFGIVDTSFSPARGYMEIVEKRDKHTLLNILKKVCLPCSKIHSDQWSAYRDIEILVLLKKKTPPPKKIQFNKKKNKVMFN